MGISEQVLRSVIDGLLVEAGGAGYDPKVSERQADAVARYIRASFVSVDNAASLVSRAREHELMAVMDLVASLPGARGSAALVTIKRFAGQRVAAIRLDRDVTNL